MKDYVIYLNRKPTVCDIYVSVIPFREATEVSNVIYIDSRIDDTYLATFIQVPSGILLSADADENIRKFEKIRSDMELAAETNLVSMKLMSLEETGIVAGSEVLGFLATTAERVNNSVVIHPTIENAELFKYIGASS